MLSVSYLLYRFQAIEMDNKFFVNPGSATGAWTGSFNGYVARFILVPSADTLVSDPVPSFALLDIQGPIVVTYVYQLIDGEVRVEKIEWRKEIESVPVAAAKPPSPAAGSPPGSSVW
jgi:vacuolar protein sorting-associated protein 29